MCEGRVRLSTRMVILMAAVSFLSICIRAPTTTAVADARAHRPQAEPENCGRHWNVHAKPQTLGFWGLWLKPESELGSTMRVSSYICYMTTLFTPRPIG